MRSTITISPRAGESVWRTSRHLYREARKKDMWAALLLVFGIAVAARGAPTVGLLLAGGAVLLVRRARRLNDEGRRYRLGAESEEKVGMLLEEIAAGGWQVEHDVAKRGGGNIDHVVHSPEVTFVIDTKRSAWRGADIGQAHRHAAWAARHYGRRRLIVPVICVQRSRRGVELVDGVYIVGASGLLSFLWDRG